MKKTHNETVVGFFVVIGFVLLSLIVFFVSGVYVFRPGYKVNVLYDYVSILDKGAPIRMAGVRIGEVNQVQLFYDKTTQHVRVKVKLFIEKGVEIRENYKFMIRGTHILSEPHIEISPEPGNYPMIKENQTIEGADPIPVEDIIERAHHITENLDSILQGIRSAVDDKEGGASVKNIIKSLASVTQSLETILSGNEKEIEKAILNLSESSESLQNVLEKIEKGNGTVGKLLMQDELYQELRGFVAEIKAHPWRLMKRDKKFGIF